MTEGDIKTVAGVGQATPWQVSAHPAMMTHTLYCVLLTMVQYTDDVLCGAVSIDQPKDLKVIIH